jgi:hypothetical protein
MCPKCVDKNLFKKFSAETEFRKIDPWLTPEWLAGGGREHTREVGVAAVACGVFPISVSGLALTGDKLRMGWWSVKVTLVLVSMSACIVSWSRFYKSVLAGI